MGQWPHRSRDGLRSDRSPRRFAGDNEGAEPGAGTPARARRSGRGSGVLGRLRRDLRGASAVLFGFALPVLIGFLGLGVEISFWYLEKRELQEAADSSAMAGSREYAANNAGQTAMESAAAAAAAKSGFASAGLVLNQPPASGRFATGGALEDPAAVEVILTETYATHFVSLFGMTTATIKARAVATEGGDEAETTACILALAETEPEICDNHSTGIIFQGSLDLETSECGIHSNDSCGPSYDFNGNPSVDVDCLTYSGGSDPGEDPISGDSSNLALSGCDAPAYHEPIPDPYENVTIPADVGPCVADHDGVTVDGEMYFTPGYYCDPAGPADNIELGGGINHLAPGVYFFDGDVHINAGVALRSDGPVTLVLRDGHFDYNGGAELTLIAPTADDIYDSVYAPGFNLIQGQGMPPNHYWDGLALYIAEVTSLGDSNPCPNKINGTSDVNVSGAVYAPDTCITFTGDNATAGTAGAPCFRMVAGNITLAGNVGMGSAECEMPGGAGQGGPGSVSYGTVVGLVE
jgi:Flp pilus assembly protein TadG